MTLHISFFASLQLCFNLWWHLRRCIQLCSSTVSSLDWTVFLSVHYTFIVIHFAFHRRWSWFFHLCEIWSHDFQSCVFHPCDLVSHFLVRHFPFPRFQSPLSTEERPKFKSVYMQYNSTETCTSFYPPVTIYTVRQKTGNQFSFVCIFLMLDRNGWFVHIH